jgi:hypothetical protein
MKYLKGTQMSHDDIAERVGYSDASNFRRAFKRWTNQSPNRFRNDLIAEAANDRQVVPYGPPRRYRPMPESSCRASGAIDVTYRIDWLGIGYRYRFEQPLRSEP